MFQLLSWMVGVAREDHHLRIKNREGRTGFLINAKLVVMRRTPPFVHAAMHKDGGVRLSVTRCQRPLTRNENVPVRWHPVRAEAQAGEQDCRSKPAG